MAELGQRPAGNYYGEPTQLDFDAYCELLSKNDAWMAWKTTAVLTGGANLLDGHPTHHYADSHKHDLQMMLRCCQTEMAEAEATWNAGGGLVAPYYFWRAAVLFSKQKRYWEEIKICELYLELVAKYAKHTGQVFEEGVPGGRGMKILERLEKARLKLHKQSVQKLQALPQ